MKELDKLSKMVNEISKDRKITKIEISKSPGVDFKQPCNFHTSVKGGRMSYKKVCKLCDNYGYEIHFQKKPDVSGAVIEWEVMDMIERMDGNWATWQVDGVDEDGNLYHGTLESTFFEPDTSDDITDIELIKVNK